MGPLHDRRRRNHRAMVVTIGRKIVILVKTRRPECFRLRLGSMSIADLNLRTMVVSGGF